jgi:uracil-DNA glycosylase family 4
MTEKDRMKKDQKQKKIDNLNQYLKKCTGCRLSLTRNNVLPGEGNINASLMFIALAPGKQEDLEGRMFIGPSGKILNRLFLDAGINRESVYMTNLTKCILPKNRKPKMDEIESCSIFLDQEIYIIHPELIVPLGFYATRYILEKYHTDPPAARLDFTKLYGELIFSEKQKIYPLPHPSSLIYNPSYEPETIEKYKKLKILPHECKWFAMCPMKGFYEQGRLEQKWIELYCKGLWSECVRYRMEENGSYHPDWMLPDGTLYEKLKGN